MIAQKKEFHDRWETLQKKLGKVLSTAYNGNAMDYVED